MWNQISQQISRTIGQHFEAKEQRPIGGGCINQGYKLSDRNQTFFVKLNSAEQLSMFAAEAQGLADMAKTKSIRVPQPVCYGVADRSCYLVMEWLELGRAGTSAWREMGRKLAQMHQTAGATAFGWSRDNTIGATPQINTWSTNWIEFWQIHRIGYQLDLARRRGGHFPQGDRLFDAIPDLLQGHDVTPALVHGDLWGGNAAVTDDGEPVIFDPAVYWGDREVDLAMTELFGGFPAEFYAGYNEVYPVDSGYKTRKTLYNLYHILNHYNLFGSGYQEQADRMMAQLLG